jgi:hypothetical protein
MCSRKKIDGLADEITELASHIHAATCRWLGLVAEFERCGGWAEWGCRSCAQWLSWRCSISPAAAREHVRVALRLCELPLIRGAFAEGRLSYSQVRALTRVERVAHEQELLSLARHATAAQLERLVRAYRGVVARARAAEGGGHERFVTWDHADDGSLLLHARLPADEGAVVLAALQAAVERLDGRASAEAPPLEPACAEAPAVAPASAEAPAVAPASVEAPASESPSADAPAIEPASADAPAIEPASAETPALDRSRREPSASESPSAEAAALEPGSAEAAASDAASAEAPALDRSRREPSASDAACAEAAAVVPACAEMPAVDRSRREPSAPDAASAEVPASEPACAEAPRLGERRADALVLMADTLLAGEPDGRGGERYQVVVHVDTAALRDREGEGELADGAPIVADTVRRLACDAAIVPLLERAGRPLSVGRKTRSVPPALRRALESRDRGCRFPGCTNDRTVDAHHIEHWANGGQTCLENLVQLCRHHHRLLHEGGYSVTKTRAGFVFRRPDGRQIRPVPRPPRGCTGQLRESNRRGGHTIDPEATVTQWAGERFDLGYNVDALLTFAPPEAPGI